jgi:hypothetical protein
MSAIQKTIKLGGGRMRIGFEQRMASRYGKVKIRRKTRQSELKRRVQTLVRLLLWAAFVFTTCSLRLHRPRPHSLNHARWRAQHRDSCPGTTKRVYGRSLFAKDGRINSSALNGLARHCRGHSASPVVNRAFQSIKGVRVKRKRI